MSLRETASHLYHQGRDFRATHQQLVRRGGKAILAVVSFFSFALFMGWLGALVLMGIIAVHEGGHMLAMKVQGVKTNGFVFIPFLGGGTSPKDGFHWRYDEAFVALAGPLAGMLMAAAFGLLYLVTGSTLCAAIAAATAEINLLNLIPIMPLDGGRVLKALVYSIGPRFGIACEGLLCGLMLHWSFTFSLICLVAVFFLFVDIVGEITSISSRRRYDTRRQPKRMSILGGIGTVSEFILVSGSLMVVCWLVGFVPHLHTALHIIGL